MPTTPGTADTTARTVDEQFLDLIYSDQELLAAEFNAIIAAEWPSPPANPHGRGATDRPPPVGQPTAQPTLPTTRASRPQHPDTGGWARQRSPPPRQARTHDRKAGDRRT